MGWEGVGRGKEGRGGDIYIQYKYITKIEFAMEIVSTEFFLF